MNLEQWCEKIGLPNIYLYLKEYVERPKDLTLASEEEIKEIIQACGLTMKEKLTFKREILALKTPSGEKKSEENTPNIPRNPIAPNKRGVFVVPTVKKEDIQGPWKTIFVTGQTGAGKSTTLNSMVNYLWHVQPHDKYRFNLIPPPDEKKDGTVQAESVTQTVTSYHIKPPGLPYGLTVVDSPGFGDCRGLGQDQKILYKHIKEHFEKELDTIDAICFVIKASSVRLNNHQEYIFNQMVKIFAKDVSKNVFIWFTFCDEGNPPALAAVKKSQLEYAKHFKLNNCAFFLGFADYKAEPWKQIYCDPGYRDESASVSHETVGKYEPSSFWKYGTEQMKTFFDELSLVEPQSLTLSKEVLNERAGLQNAIADIQSRIGKGLDKLAKIEQKIEFIKKHARQINKNAKYKIPETTTDVREVKTKKGNTTCLFCRYTCHENCWVSWGETSSFKDLCTSMNWSGKCRVCPNRCSWTNHHHKYYKIVRTQVDGWTTVEAMKSKFDEATANMTTAERSVIACARQIVEMQRKVKSDVERVRLGIVRLNEIAMKPCVLEKDDYFEKMIQTERETRRGLWRERIQEIQKLKAQATVLRDIHNKEKKKEAKPLFHETLAKIERDLEEVRRIQAEGAPETRGSYTLIATVESWFRKMSPGTQSGNDRRDLR